MLIVKRGKVRNFTLRTNAQFNVMFVRMCSRHRILTPQYAAFSNSAAAHEAGVEIYGCSKCIHHRTLHRNWQNVKN